MHESENEETAMTVVVDMPAMQLLAIADEPQIKRTRKILLIVLSIFLVGNRRSETSFRCPMHLFRSLVDFLSDGYDLLYRHGIVFFLSDPLRFSVVEFGVRTGVSLIAILYYSLWLSVARQYRAIGLRVVRVFQKLFSVSVVSADWLFQQL